MQGAGAVWDIWRREDLDTLRGFLRDYKHLFPAANGNGTVKVAPWQDPVRSQEFMLHDCHRELLWRLTGVQAWHFEQNDGEGVFIPSGCAHQVRLPLPALDDFFGLLCKSLCQDSTDDCMHI